MAQRRRTRIPKRRLHKPSGLAFVQIRGKRYYLGPYGSPKSQEEYHKVLAKLTGSPEAEADALVADIRARHALTLNELLLSYWRHAQEYYATGDEAANMWPIVELLMDSYGTIEAAKFGPLALKSLRQKMIETPNSRGMLNTRTYINQQVNRIRRIFKWAVEEELVSATVLHALQAVSPLKYGRCPARESAPVTAVPEEFVYELLPFLAPPVRAMVELQLLTGMRAQSATAMRATEIDMTGDVWIYTPTKHKTSYRGHKLQIPLGPRAQEIIRPFLSTVADAYLFRPIDAETWRNEQRRAGRKTPLTPSQRARRPKRRGRRRPGEKYDTRSYGRAIRYAFRRLAIARGHADARKYPTVEWLESVGIAYWHSHQLRHRQGTNVRKKFGFEAAQTTLGHKSDKATSIYAEKNFELAIQVAREIG